MGRSRRSRVTCLTAAFARICLLVGVEPLDCCAPIFSPLGGVRSAPEPDVAQGSFELLWRAGGCASRGTEEGQAAARPTIEYSASLVSHLNVAEGTMIPHASRRHFLFSGQRAGVPLAYTRTSPPQARWVLRRRGANLSPARWAKPAGSQMRGRSSRIRCPRR